MTTPDHRDRALDAALRRTAMPGPAIGPCLDADTLAAWAEQRLTGVALRRAEGHMADCARCQATLAALVKAAPELGLAGEHEERSTKWWGWFDVRWLVPLTATAVLVWMLVPGDPLPDQMARLEPPPADRPLASEAPRPSTPTPPAPGTLAGADTRERKAVPQELVESDANARANERVAEGRAVAQPAQPARQDVAAEAAGARASAEPPAPVVAPAAPAASLSRDAAARFEAAAAPPAAPAAAPPLAKAAAEAVGENRLRSSAVRIPSGDASVQWRLAPPSAVERSTDGGSTWTRLDTGSSTRVNAGSAPARAVCWLVGENGLILLTTDGRTWRAVSSPVAESLVAVEATDATTAVVRAASGRAFRTTDGGGSWTRLP